MFFRLYCQPTVYGRQRNGLKDCRTLQYIVPAPYTHREHLLYYSYTSHKCLSQRIETTVYPRGDGDLEAMHVIADRPYGTQYNISYV